MVLLDKRVLWSKHLSSAAVSRSHSILYWEPLERTNRPACLGMSLEWVPQQCFPDGFDHTSFFIEYLATSEF